MKNKTTSILLIATIALTVPLFTAAQNIRTPADKKMLMLHETPGDTYLPNADNNEKTSPAYNYKKTAALKLLSSITITQVNVDAEGQNILGDAANEPNIAVNPVNTGEIVIGWRQFDNVFSNFRQAGWSYTSDSGQAWTFPGVLEPGIFRSDPVLDYDASGNFYYNSLTAPSFACKVFKSNNGGAAWDNGTNAGGGDKQWMTIDRTEGVGSGNIYAFWTSAYSSCPPGFFTRSTDGGSSYENCTEVDGEPFWGSMAVNNDGELYIAGSDTNGNILVEKSLNAQTPGSIITWNPAVSVFMDGYVNYGISVNPEGLLGMISIDVDRSGDAGQGNVYVLASMTRLSNGDDGDVMFAKSTDGGLTWGSPIQVNDDNNTGNTQWLGTMSAAPNGRIDAIWLDTRDAPGSDLSALYYSYSTDDGDTWSVNEKLTDSFDPHVGYPNQIKMGDYFDMVSDNTGVHLAWANTFNGEEDVYYSRIIPQNVTGLNEISGKTAISIFPNPTSGGFTITNSKSTGTNQSDVEIYNVMGKQVYSATISTNTSEIDISSQPAGIYFLKILNQDGSIAVKKIIRE